jgi:dTDP-4-dehydrorhamnose 3,5-epimerase
VKVTQTDLPGVLIIEPIIYRDQRGFFLETYQERKYAALGLASFVQDNHSGSVKGSLRGLHAQLDHPQAKLVRVVKGEIFDVAVDLRRGSANFGRWVGVTLSAENAWQCYIPGGFAHGFCVLSDTAEVEYKCSDYYDPADEVTLLWNDPGIGIDWPVTNPLLSLKDQSGLKLEELLPRLPQA